MRLIMQLHADLPKQFPSHERQLYVFMCPRKVCWRKNGCVRAIRGIRASEIKQSKPNKSEQPASQQEKSRGNIGATLFGSTGSANPFSGGSSSSSNPFATSKPSVNPFGSVLELAAKPAQVPEVVNLSETFAAKVKIASESVKSAAISVVRPHEPWPEAAKLPEPYPLFYFDAEYESLEQSTPQPQTETMDLGDDSGGGKEDKVLYESALDKAFQKFADRVEQNPEQALRYEFGGIPLLYSTTDAVGKLLAPSQKDHSKVKTVSSGSGHGCPGMQRCPNCGQSRVFEAQLVPHAITALEEEEMTIEGMDWGTIIVGVCGKDCSPSDVKEAEVGYLEEWVGVQWEELDDRKR
jgi:pre-rRNA-processing protein TSR4